MKCIVTGGAGFIGSHLVKFLLKKKFRVIVLDNLISGDLKNLDSIKNQIKFINCDISTTGKWQKNFKNIDIVFHLAALADIVPSVNQPKKYFRHNVIGSFNLVLKLNDPKHESLCRWRATRHIHIYRNNTITTTNH